MNKLGKKKKKKQPVIRRTGATCYYNLIDTHGRVVVTFSAPSLPAFLDLTNARMAGDLCLV